MAFGLSLYRRDRFQQCAAVTSNVVVVFDGFFIGITFHFLKSLSLLLLKERVQKNVYFKQNWKEKVFKKLIRKLFVHYTDIDYGYVDLLINVFT